MIAHKLHFFLVHSSSLSLVSPRVHALFVPWKNKPEVTIPPPTCRSTVELITVVNDVQKREEYEGPTRMRDSPPSPLES